VDVFEHTIRIRVACVKHSYRGGRFRPITPDEHAILESICEDDPDWIPGPERRRRRWRGPTILMDNLQLLSHGLQRAALTAPLDDAREMMRTVHEVWVSMLNAKWNDEPDTRALWWAAYRTGMRNLSAALPENRAALDAGLRQRAGKGKQGRAEALALRDRVRELMREHGWSVTKACADVDGELSTGTTYKRLSRRGLLPKLDTSKVS